MIDTLKKIVEIVSENRDDFESAHLVEFPDENKGIIFHFSDNRALSAVPDPDSNDWLYTTIGGFEKNDG